MSEFRHNLLLHQRTQAQVEAFLRHPSHALLLTGSAGSGKPTLAKAIAANLLDLELPKLDNYPYFIHIGVSADKQEIPVEAVRELIEKLRLKTPGSADVRRVVLVEDAHTMSSEGQNALLKTLEEPGLDTVFILTAPFTKSVLPTIASRSQNIEINSVTLQSTQDYFGDRFSKTDIASHWQLSGGLVGLIDALLKDSSEHPLKLSVNNFKDFLSMDTYGRLIEADKLARDKVQLAYFLDGGGRVLRALQNNAIKSDQTKFIKSLSASRKLIHSLQDTLQANANTRLVAMSLALNLKL